MGHVYRAEDMKLGQTVALKFLPPSMTDNARHLELMLSEVRLARQVSSPYVCRVHDIVEADGVRFLSMEYVDGENLAGLLRRIRRLPADRAQEIAWQICEGLGAAHAMGVLHRDLKPANLMIDGLGRPKITDFGLALDVEDAAAKSEVAGTPGYIAPEVAHGQPVSVQSDLFGLGAILYEIYTGHRAVESGAPAKPGQSSASSRISAHFPKDVPKPVQLVILQCLEPDPAKRPRSTREVAAAFPVRDALALAEAAGQTPSPEMVAAAGSDEPLALWKAWAILLFIIAASVSSMPYVAKWIFAPALSPWVGPPAQFEMLTQNLLRELGDTAKPSDAYSYFESNDAVIAEHLRRADRGEQKGRGPRNSTEGGLDYEQGLSLYTYRQRATGILVLINPFSNLDWNDPPADEPGMINIEMDSRGHLLNFLAIPPREAPQPSSVQEPPWRVAFTAAGIDPALIAEVPAAIVPAVPFDWRKQWRGTMPGYPNTPVQVVATGFAGKLTAFRVLSPWDALADSEKYAVSAWQLAIWTLMPLLGTLVVAFFAVRNLRRDRADIAATLRLAVTIGVLYFLRQMLRQRFVPDIGDTVTRILIFIAMALLWGGLCGIIYLAIEPYLRRRVPRLLISWTQLMKGQWRSPLLGKDLLAAVVLVSIEFPFGVLFVKWNEHYRTGHAFPVTGTSLEAIYRPLHWVGNVMGLAWSSIYMSLFILSLYFVFRAVFRVRLIAMAALGVFLFFFGGGPPHYTQIDYILINLVIAALCAIAALRFGLLTMAVFGFVASMELQGPLTFDFSQWYAPAVMANFALVLAIAICGFWIAIGDQRMLGNFKLDD